MEIRVGGFSMGVIPAALSVLKRLGYWARQGNVAERRLGIAFLAGNSCPMPSRPDR
jgi:hypothetical protein